MAIAQPKIDFEPDGHTVRLVQQGIPPHKYWAVSFWRRNASGGGYTRITVVVVDAESGRITQIKRAK